MLGCSPILQIRNLDAQRLEGISETREIIQLTAIDSRQWFVAVQLFRPVEEKGPWRYAEGVQKDGGA